MTMERHKTLQCVFEFIAREEIHVECEFETLDKRLELKNAMEKKRYCDLRHSWNVIIFGYSTKTISQKFRHLQNQFFYVQATRELQYE